MPIHQLIYISQATKKMSNEDLLEILKVSKRNNQKINVTGSLFYNSGWFLQVLEGVPSTINDIYNRIEKDTRHKNACILYNEPTKSRTFLNWSMSITNLDDKDSDKYEQLIEIMDAAKSQRKIGATSPAVTLLKIFTKD